MTQAHPKPVANVRAWMPAAIAVACSGPGCGPRQSPDSRQPAAATASTPEPESSSAAVVPAPASAAEPASPDCEALALAWRRELLGEGNDSDPEVLAEIERRAGAFPCELRLDLDGDRADERVYITSAGRDRSVGVGIEWGDGHTSILGAGNPIELQPGLEDEDDPIQFSDFGWLQHWRPAPLRDGAFEVQVLHNLVRIDAPDALGDGLQVSGGDAAAIVYFDGAEWRWIHLGY